MQRNAASGLFTTSSFVADKTGITLALLLMTGFTGFHGHDFRGITGNPFIPVGRIFFRLTSHRGMTGPAIQLGHFQMSRMRKEDMVRLFGIDQPGNILFFFF
jgi:hypothetical protein